MKKVLIVFDGAHFPTALLDFASALNNTNPIFLTGIFLPSVDYAEAMTYLFYGNAIPPFYLQEYEIDPISIQKNIAQFRDYCETNRIRYSVHKDIKKRVPKELKYETRYADLLLLSSNEFYENLGEKTQGEYLQDTLHEAECPVILMPKNYMPVKNIVLAYDGSSASMRALKQFIYLLPEFTDLDTLIVYADAGREEIPFLHQIQEYAPRHFNKLAYYKLEAEPEHYFDTWLANREATFLVSGSYGRSSWSEFFHKSFVTDVIKEQKHPLFIAHI